VNDALVQMAAVHKLADDLPDDVIFCTKADEVRKAHRDGKIAALIGVEGGHMINNSLPILREFSRLGVRYMTLTHFFNTDWADSSGEAPKHNGLTDLGRQVVREMNRLGMIVDVPRCARPQYGADDRVAFLRSRDCRTRAQHERRHDQSARRKGRRDCDQLPRPIPRPGSQ
jgi:membrane dipeptidase